MPVIEAIKLRNSNALMTEADVDPDVIRQILDAAVCAPVHHRTNPWRFLVIRGAGRKKLGEVMADHLARDFDDPDSPKNVKFLEKIRKKPLRAPVIIVAGAAKSDKEQVLMVEDVAAVSAACQNILLAASALGLSAFWRTGSVTYSEHTVTSLGFDKDTELVGFIYLGHPKKQMPPKTRQTAAEFTRWMEY
ncbi:MAG: nitroreductase [Alphaproteobacteria bacterium]|nr:MAG: nitroreductase [Alphaproteobacteria bacterium]